MKINRIHSKNVAATGLLLAMLLSVSAQSATAMEDSTNANFDGRWASITCELRPQAGQDGKIQSWFLKRDIEVKGNKLDAAFTTYADGECKVPLWKLEFGATMTNKGSVPTIPGALKIDLAVDRYNKVGPLAQGFADFLNSAGEGTCGSTKATVGLVQDIGKTGCKAFGLPPGTVIREVEVMTIQNGMLFFAARPVDGSSPYSDDKRVMSLQVPLIKTK